MSTELNRTLSDIRSLLAVNEERWKVNTETLGRITSNQEKHGKEFTEFKDLVEHSMDTIADYTVTKQRLDKIEKEHQFVKGAAKAVGIIGVVTGGIIGAIEAGLNIFGKS